MTAHRIDEWYKLILRIRRRASFVCVGRFPEALARKFLAIAIPYRQVEEIEQIDASYDGIAWIIEEISGEEMISKLFEVAKTRSPSRIFFELSSKISIDQRPRIEQIFFDIGYRKSSDYHVLVNFEDNGDWNTKFSFEKMPKAWRQKYVGHNEALSESSYANGDMLRKSDRNSETFTMRYHWAARQIRGNEVVLDAGCGTGYGASIIANNSECSKIIGLDFDSEAVLYAQSAYASTSKRIAFEIADVLNPLNFEDDSVQAIIAFDLLESLPDYVKFISECCRVLDPGGRLICSLRKSAFINGVEGSPDESPMGKIRRHLADFFLIEHVLALHGGENGGVRSLTEDASFTDSGADYLLVVGMKNPIGAGKKHFQNRHYSQMEAPGTNMGAFARDYDNPWLVSSVIYPGVRTTSKQLLRELATREVEQSQPASPDRGGVLCVLGYQYLEAGDFAALDRVIEEIKKFFQAEASNAHHIRWKISLKFLLGRIYMEKGNRAAARESFLSCANEDCLQFGPTLGTKIIEALFWHGWLLLQDKMQPEALASWQRGLVEAERILKSADWSELYGQKKLPFDWGFVEAMIILHKAQQCAFAIYAIESGVYEPEQLDLEIIFHFTLRNSINREHLQFLSEHNQDLLRLVASSNNEMAQLRAENKKASEVIFNQEEFIALLKDELDKKDRVLKKLQTKL
jgi:SAM-dependent methyltransferase